MEVEAEDWPTPDQAASFGPRPCGEWASSIDPAYDEATAAIAKRAKEACRVVPRLWPLAV